MTFTIRLLGAIAALLGIGLAAVPAQLRAQSTPSSILLPVLPPASKSISPSDSANATNAQSDIPTPKNDTLGRGHLLIDAFRVPDAQTMCQVLPDATSDSIGLMLKTIDGTDPSHTRIAIFAFGHVGQPVFLVLVQGDTVIDGIQDARVFRVRFGPGQEGYLQYQRVGADGASQIATPPGIERSTRNKASQDSVNAAAPMSDVSHVHERTPSLNWSFRSPNDVPLPGSSIKDAERLATTWWQNRCIDRVAPAPHQP